MKDREVNQTGALCEIPGYARRRNQWIETQSEEIMWGCSRGEDRIDPWETVSWV